MEIRAGQRVEVVEPITVAFGETPLVIEVGTKCLVKTVADDGLSLKPEGRYFIAECVDPAKVKLITG